MVDLYWGGLYFHPCIDITHYPKNPIHSALLLVLTLLCVAVLYILLYSQFIAIIQIVVYAGAIVMLIVFVIMLLDLEQELRSGLKLFYSKVIGWHAGRSFSLRDHLFRSGEIPDGKDGLLYN